MAEATLILEASAARRSDLTFQIPIGRLRLLRGQIESQLGLPKDCTEYNPSWSICCKEMAAVLTLAEGHAALEEKDAAEEQIIRLKNLLVLCMSWPQHWWGSEDDDYFRLRCFRSNWEPALKHKDDDDISYAEKAQVVLEHLDSLFPVFTGHGGRCATSSACSPRSRARVMLLLPKKELEDVPYEEQTAFFRRLQDEKKATGKNLPWKTIKAQLIALVTTRTITSQSSDVTTEELPLSVWQARGWDAETVQNCPREWSEALKIHLYKVPTKKVVWKEAHEKITERILRQEREVEKARRKKGKNAPPEDDLDLPEAPASEKEKDKDDKKEAKAAESAVRKTQQTNAKTNMIAAKSIGQLSNDLQSLTKSHQKASQVPDNVEAACKETKDTLERWIAAAKSTLQQAEDERAKSGEIALPALPFDATEVRTLHQTCGEVVKNLKPYLPVPKAKAKADAKRPADDGSGNAAPAKRRRAKSSAK
eukprot:s4446_g1.t1